MVVPRYGVVVVRGRSMTPTLREGDRLLVRYGAVPRMGELVVVRFPNCPLAVKRVFRHDRDGWWVERDNPREGLDSWLLGPVPDSALVAVVRGRVWPPVRLLSGARLRHPG